MGKSKESTDLNPTEHVDVDQDKADRIAAAIVEVARKLASTGGSGECDVERDELAASLKAR